MKAYDLKIISNTPVSERYWHLKLDAQPVSDDINPGQFFNIKCPDAAFLRRPFSIYRINKAEKTIEFLYLVKGIGTAYLTEAVPGEHLNIFGPLGKGFELKKEWGTILLLARGVGIATLAALAQEAIENQIKCIAVLSARTNNDLLSTEMLKHLGAEIYKVTEEDGTSDVEYVEELIKNLLKANRIQAAFTCGSKRLSKLLQRMTKAADLPVQIAMEENMGCAMGVCYACVCDIQEEDGIHSVRICREGPVFDLNKVVLK